MPRTHPFADLVIIFSLVMISYAETVFMLVMIGRVGPPALQMAITVAILAAFLLVFRKFPVKGNHQLRIW